MKVILVITLVLVKSLFCSLYAQQNPDLIVTATGDSIRCNIINVDANEIQFRLGIGNLVTIRHNEISSYSYNFFAGMQTETPATSPTRVSSTGASATLPSTAVKSKQSRFYMMISSGVVDFGSVSFGDAGGFTFAGGADAAFFLTPWLKAGAKFNVINANIEFSNMYGDMYTYNDMIMFYGAALHGSFGKGAFKINLCASAGMMNWQLSNRALNGIDIDNTSSTSTGGLFSAGVSYRFAKNVGVGLNMQTAMLGNIKNEAENIERKPSGTGAMIGIFFTY